MYLKTIALPSRRKKTITKSRKYESTKECRVLSTEYAEILRSKRRSRTDSSTLLADGSVISYGMAQRRDGVWVEAKDTGTYTIVGNRLNVNLKQFGNTSVTIVRVGNSATVKQDDGRC